MSPLLMNKKTKPTKPIINPIILYLPIVCLYNIIPIIRVKIGVSAFKIPARELFIFVSARQKRKAGKKLPNKPDVMIQRNLFAGILLNDRKAKGSKTIPPLSILKEATS